jgi:hypothetical protein
VAELQELRAAVEYERREWEKAKTDLEAVEARADERRDELDAKVATARASVEALGIRAYSAVRALADADAGQEQGSGHATADAVGAAHNTTVKVEEI